MTENGRAVRLRPSAIGAAWQAFWFRLEPMYTLGLYRMVFGALAVLWTFWLLPMRHDMLGPAGVAPRQVSIPYTWGVFEFWTSDLSILIGWAVLLVSAIALIVGWHSRLAAVLVFVLILSFQRRDPSVFNGGDAVVRIEALLLALSPCGAALSLDQRRRTGSFWSAQVRRIWPVRLLQVQLSIIYLASVELKLNGQTWWQGTAVSYALRLKDMQRFSPPEWFSTNALIMNAMTWGSLVIELSVAILVWNRRLRPWVLAAGVLLHLMIDIHIQIGIFSYAMFTLYIAWVSPQTVQRLPETLKHAPAGFLALLRRRRFRASARIAGRHRAEGTKPQLDEAVSTSAASNGASAVEVSNHEVHEVDQHEHLDQPPVGRNGAVAAVGLAQRDRDAVP